MKTSSWKKGANTRREGESFIISRIDEFTRLDGNSSVEPAMMNT